MDMYLDSISTNEEVSIGKAESVLMEVKSIIMKREYELYFKKMEKKYSLQQQLKSTHPLHDLSTPEVGEILGRTPATVRNYIKSGRLIAYKTDNGDIRVSQSELASFLTILRNEELVKK
jgi:hypothetical protein